MPKQQINFRASALTSAQLAALAKSWGTTQSEAISIIVDRVFQQELGKQEEKPTT